MLDEQIKIQIQSAYRQYLQGRGFHARQGQKLLIAHAANHLIQDPAQVAVVEAGTGTGKTLGYVLGALAVSQARQKILIISTATIALQEQLVLRDIPDLIRLAGLNVNFELAKGRGRYLCLTRLEQALEQEGQAADLLQSSLDLEPQQRSQSQAMQQRLQGYMQDFAQGKWNGELDDLAEPISDELRPHLVANHRQCSNRRCSHFEQCPFYRARARLDQAQIVVVNHDLLLSDLALGGGVILPAPEECLHVLDEAHHLAEKALTHFAAHCQLNQLLDGQNGFVKRLDRLKIDALVLENLQDIQSLQDGCLSLGQHAQFLQQYLDAAFDLQEGERHRFVMGELPEALLQLIQPFAECLQTIVPSIDKIQRQLLASIKDKSNLLDPSLVEYWHQQLGQQLLQFEQALALARLWLEPVAAESPPIGRWLELQQGHWHLDASPVNAGEHLRRMLWQKTAGALLTSATLTFAGRFDRFLAQVGLSSDTPCLRVASPFDYQRSVLQVPLQVPDAKNAQLHSQWLMSAGLDWLDPDEGTLILFASRRQMLEVTQAWQQQAPKWPWLIQGQQGRLQMLKQHHSRCEAGKGSILVGLNSLAEGLDLPGKLLTHVVIAKLPFATPDDPISATLSEWLTQRGQNPFMSITVPEAAIRLVQACGRLVRSEQDQGRITLFDNRLYTKAYGQQLLATLPDFQRTRPSK